MSVKIFALCLMLFAGRCIGAPADDITETTTKRPAILDCVDFKCPGGAPCAIVDCFYNFDPDYCGNKCLGIPADQTTTTTETAITKRPPIPDCVDLKCPGGGFCAAVDCFENFDPDYCGNKCLGIPVDQPTTEPTTTESSLFDCVDGHICPTGYACAAIDCFPESWDPARCGSKCLHAVTIATTTKRPALKNCVGSEGDCEQGYACLAIDCIPESWDNDYCGTKCVALPTAEGSSEKK